MDQLDIFHVREEYEEEEVRRLNLQQRLTPFLESLLILEQTSKESEEVEVGDEIMKGEEAKIHIKAKEAIDRNKPTRQLA